ncbi:uncharacterized protein N7477_006067 [Penicillium maclennaniae]|uniref:uncharacterized protein n=1 Tax=Penicillium maclennaniae TaxID=1343394 RepID=UPI002541518F|nr:uncharacterized protein N7477_006067 [Penicillium maclennaniae]KAJ5670704.1 hypothetical protein N7477_006067 [Penicillium maclennaniae]
MQYWNTIHDSDVAPSPIVPTYRPNPPSKRRHPSMSSPTSAAAENARPSFGSVGSMARPQARSAGMAERPGRNENLSDLVRFFQTQNMPAPPVVTTPDSTTALPVVHSPPKGFIENAGKVDKEDKVGKEQLKPLHRRLLQFTQRQKKEPSLPKSKQDEQQKQIEALMREGYLFSGSSKPASSSKSTRSTRSIRSKNSIDHKSSIDRASISSSKRHDVETIGQPWLEKQNQGGSPMLPSDDKRCLASLDLGDFGAMVDAAVSPSSTDESSSTPYRPSQSSQHSASQSTSALPLPSSLSDTRPQNAHRASTSIASTVNTQDSGSLNGFTNRLSSSTNSSTRAADCGVTPSSLARSNAPASMHTIASSDQSVNSELKQEQDSAKPTDRVPSNPPSLKLFPDVSPRVSSKNAWRLSAVPRYQTPIGKPLSAKDEQAETPITVKPGDHETSSENPPGPADSEAKIDRPGASKFSKKSIMTSKAAVPTPPPPAQSKVKPRPQSLTLGALQAFPLPAPTRPLPSIPDARGSPNTHLDVKANLAIRVMRSGSGLRILDLQTSQPSPIAEDPSEPEARPATVLGCVDEGDASGEHQSLHPRASLECSKSAVPDEPTPTRRSSSVCAPRMQDLQETPVERDGDLRILEGEAVADSPVLGRQHISTETQGKRHLRKDLHINSRVDRKNLPFGLPSPPPTASLPTDPPQMSVERSVRHRNFTAPSGASVPSSRKLDHHRVSIISRSNSSRSSLRHESIPESYEPNHCESPIPSSDDEGFGPQSQSTRGRRPAETYSKRKDPARRGYDTLDARTSHTRLRYAHQSRPLTPQGRSSHSMEKPVSPHSQYSQSPHRSRDSQNSYRSKPARGPVPDFLEDRIANLERQNQVLQAALMAALNAGVVKNHMDVPSRSSEHSGFETSSSLQDRRADVRQLDDMIEDIESGWLSDKSSLSGPHTARHH